MSQQPVLQPAPYVYVQRYVPPRTNGLGVAGFIVSLLGIISCGLLSPIGLVLSGIALFKSPRGFALAGFILGLLGSIWAILAAIFIGIAGIATALGIGVAAPYIEAGTDMARISMVVEANKRPDGTVPTDLATLPGLDSKLLNDPWGHPYRVVPNATSFDIVSDGPDGVAGTADDMTFHEGDHPPRRHHGRRSRDVQPD